MSKPIGALLLVGGRGTRLVPLTKTRSKPLVEFCNKPVVEPMLDALVSVGVRTIVFALTELQHDLAQYVKDYQATHEGVRIIPSVEEYALGTAGPLALARAHLEGGRFFVLNADIVTKFPLKELLEAHIAAGGEGTLATWDVEDPRRYGVIESAKAPGIASRILKFTEKPPDKSHGCSINAGIYIFEPAILDRITLDHSTKKQTSIEREVFPAMAAEGVLYAFPIQQERGYWADVGTPEAFVDAIALYLPPENSVLIDPSAQVDDRSQIGPNVTIGIGCKIGEGCRISDAAIFDGATVGKNCVISRAIVGWGSTVGDNAELTNYTILGSQVTVGSGTKISHSGIDPNVEMGSGGVVRDLRSVPSAGAIACSPSSYRVHRPSS